MGKKGATWGNNVPQLILVMLAHSIDTDMVLVAVTDCQQGALLLIDVGMKD